MNACCKPESTILQVGDPAPSFQANDQNGNLWKLAGHSVKDFIIIYFYPAAMTGGCSKQACGFRDDIANLEKFNVEIVGISADPVKNLKVFETYYNLNFTLLSDIDGNIAKSFGVPAYDGGTITLEIDGKEIQLDRSFTFARWTFIIDKNGIIIYKNTAADAENDSKNVSEFLQKNK